MRNGERPNDDRSSRVESDDRISSDRLVSGLSSVVPVLARLSIIGWFVAISISGGAILGWWLDSLVGSSPFLLVCGILLGVAVAMVGMVRMLSSFGDNKRNN